MEERRFFSPFVPGPTSIMTDKPANLQIRHGDRIFGPASFSQVRQLLGAGKIQDTDSVREDNGPWIVIRDYLEWKGETSGSLGDISELLGDLGPASSAPPPVEKKSPAKEDDYIPLADPEPDLVDTKEVAVRPPATEARRDKKRREPQPSPSDDVIPLADRPSSGESKRSSGNSGESRRTPAAPPRSQRKAAASPPPRSTQHSLAESQVNLPVNADLDAILNAMAEYEATAPALKVPPGRARTSGK
jgi:hypothetical protein